MHLGNGPSFRRCPIKTSIYCEVAQVPVRAASHIYLVNSYTPSSAVLNKGNLLIVQPGANAHTSNTKGTEGRPRRKQVPHMRAICVGYPDRAPSITRAGIGKGEFLPIRRPQELW